MLQDMESDIGSKEIIRKNRGKILLACMLLSYGIGNYTSSNQDTKKQENSEKNISDTEYDMNKTISSEKEFSEYLNHANLDEMSLGNTLARYLRLFRYQEDIHKYADKYKVPYEYGF